MMEHNHLSMFAYVGIRTDGLCIPELVQVYSAHIEVF